MKHFFGRWQYSVLRKVCLFLIHTMWLPGSHSAYFFLSATSKGFSPHIQKVGIALHSPLEFAPKSSLSHPGDAVWSKEFCSAVGCSWDRSPTHESSTRVREECPNHHSFSSTLHLLYSTTFKSPFHLPAQHFFGTAGGSAGAWWGGHHSVPAVSTASSCEAAAWTGFSSERRDHYRSCSTLSRGTGKWKTGSVGSPDYSLLFRPRFTLEPYKGRQNKVAKCLTSEECLKKTAKLSSFSIFHLTFYLLHCSPNFPQVPSPRNSVSCGPGLLRNRTVTQHPQPYSDKGSKREQELE